MNPTQPNQRPPPPATTMESSPRFRNTNSRGQDNSTYYNTSSHGSSAASTPGSKKLRLMCSNGGRIVPRPHDKSLCYIGGETRMVVVDRHTTIRELTHRLSKTLLRSSSSFTLKYQLPSEDLDSLISVTNDEDLENMIDEYERLMNSSTAPSRLRLFIFPTNPAESVSSSIGSFLEKSTKSSSDWFLNAPNGTSSGFSDTSSVNCLLDLDDDIEISPPEKKDEGAIVANLRGNNSGGQDVHSILDSPMMETTSSFGSASSSLANLPLIRVNNAGDHHQKVVRETGGIEEQFYQMSTVQQDDGGLVVVSGSPMTTVVREHSDPFLSYQEERSEQMSHQQQSTSFDLATANSALLSDVTITDPSSPVFQIQSSNRAAADHNTRIQTQQQQIQNSAYLLSMPTTHIESQHPQIYHQQLPVIPPLQRYIHHHHHPSVASYYNHHPPTDHQNLMYYMPVPVPVRQPPQAAGYNFPFQAALKTQFPVDDVYRATNSGAPPAQLLRVPSGHHNPAAQYVYTTTTQSIPPAAHYQNVTSNSAVEQQ